MLDVLKLVCQTLEGAGIHYMVSGSIAVNAYATPRMTRDIDLIVALKEENVADFTSLFRDRFYCDDDDIRREVRKRGMFNLIDNESGVTIDIIVKKESAYREEEFRRRKVTDAYGFPMWVVTAEDLLISKLDWIQVFQSDRQISDIMNLLDDNELDMEYIRYWVTELRLKKFDLPL